MADSDFMDDVDLQNEDFAVWAKAREMARKEPDSRLRIYTYILRQTEPDSEMVPLVQSFLTYAKPPFGVEVNKPETYIDSDGLVSAELYTDKTTKEDSPRCMEALYAAVCLKINEVMRELEHQKKLIYDHGAYKTDEWEDWLYAYENYLYL